MGLYWDLWNTVVARGLMITVNSIILTLFVLAIAYKMLPQSRMGKRLILWDEMEREKGYHSDSYLLRIQPGMEGITASELRPVGIALFGQERMDVVSDGEYIEPKTPIRVIKVDGNRVVVEKLRQV